MLSEKRIVIVQINTSSYYIFDLYANNTENAKGVAYPAINDDRLYKALIPIPPQAEQVRICLKFKEILNCIEKDEI